MILVVNFGGQYCHLIARRIRESGVKAEIIEPEKVLGRLKKEKPVGMVLSGGPKSIYEKGAPKLRRKALSFGVPVLGICYGHQLLAKMLGGKVSKGKKGQYGKKIASLSFSPLFKGLKKETMVWLSHRDTVNRLPPNSKRVASTDNCRNAGFEVRRKKIFSIQFHPEVQHTLGGNRMLKNFVFGVCGAKKNWRLREQFSILQSKLSEEVKGKKVLLGVSGGVDSLVAAAMLKKARPKKLFCVFVDNGLMRKNEAIYIKALYKKLGFRLYVVDAEKNFLRRLKRVFDPEKKRKIIGRTFIEEFESKAKQLEKAGEKIPLLGQGTIYPDRIESASPNPKASRIKSHHNVVLPKGMRFELVEPLKDFYKDEVREIGKLLGLPRKALSRHPFPGPGLGVRVLGPVDRKKIEILREADSIFIEELEKSAYYDCVWQALAALLPAKSVGVMGDSRTYEYIVSLRAVTSRDAMTADWAKLPHGFLERVSSRIINEVRGVNRVLYDISQKPPATIEYE